jgi:3-oxoacyl-[acyl-carrier protein] reductase
MQLKDKVAIVTGSGRGIGAGIADALAKEGAILIVMDRNMADAQSEANKIESAGGRAMAV